MSENFSFLKNISEKKKFDSDKEIFLVAKKDKS